MNKQREWKYFKLHCGCSISHKLTVKESNLLNSQATVWASEICYLCSALMFLSTGSSALPERLPRSNKGLYRSVEMTQKAPTTQLICTLFSPSLCFVCNTVMVERPEHLNSQNSIEQEEKQQEDGDAPDLFPGSPAKAEDKKCIRKFPDLYNNPLMTEAV